MGDAPVGADHTVEPVPVAQELADDIFTVAVAGILSRRIDSGRYGIIGHDRGGRACPAVEAEGAFYEGPEMVGEIAARIHGIFAIIEMCVATAFFGAAGGPVFDHGVDALATPSVTRPFRGLEAVHIGPGHVGIQVGILTESTDETVPARFGGKVDLRAESRCDAQGPVFFRSDVSETADEGRIEGGRQSQRSGPEGDLAAGTGVVFGRHGRLVAGIRAVVGRNAVSQSFHKGLDVVVPACCDFRTGDRGHQHMAQVVFTQEFLLRFGQLGRGNGLVAAVEHQAGDFLDGKLGGQVTGTFGGRLAPVFVDVEDPVAVEVLEGVAVLLEDRCGNVAEGRTVSLGDELIAVGLSGLPLRTARNGQKDEGQN